MTCDRQTDDDGTYHANRALRGKKPMVKVRVEGKFKSMHLRSRLTDVDETWNLEMFPKNFDSTTLLATVRLFLFILGRFVTRTGLTGGQILTIYTSHDVFRAMMYHVVFVDIPPQKSPMDSFKPNLQNLKTCIVSKLYTSKQIFTAIKTSKRSLWVVQKRASQIQDGGRPPSWKNRKIAISQQLLFDRSPRHFACWRSLTLLALTTVKNSKF